MILERLHRREKPSTGRHEVVEGGGHYEGQEERRQTGEGSGHIVGRVTRSDIMGRKSGKEFGVTSWEFVFPGAF